MIWNIFILVAGLALILVGANALTDGAASVAKRFKISDLVIGLTIVAFGTSAPELVISLLSSIQGSAEMAIGNVVGSNIFNILMIIGCTAMVLPIQVGQGTMSKEIPLVILSSFVLAFMANDIWLDGGSSNVIGRADGLVLLAFFLIFMRYTFSIARNQEGESEEQKITEMPVWRSSVYILGGLGGALFFLLAYNLFPYFRGEVYTSFLLGASASIMGVIVSAAMAAPNYPVRLFLLGEFKLKYMAVVMVLVSMLGVTSDNAGGEFAHLGGAFVGYLYAVSLRRGKDLSRPVSKLIDKLANLFRRKPKVKVYKDNRKYHYAKSDAEYNQEKAANNAAIDKILDKIKRSGYESLTTEEKRQLFDRSRNL